MLHPHVGIPFPTDKSPAGPAGPGARPTLWHLTPRGLHDHYWASRGVQVVRPSTASDDISRLAELYLLCKEDQLVLTRGASIGDVMVWSDPRVLVLGVRDPKGRPYSERMLPDADGRLSAFRRTYVGPTDHRILCTREWDVAARWSGKSDERRAGVLRLFGHNECQFKRVAGKVFDDADSVSAAAFVAALLESWSDPSAAIERVSRRQHDVFGDLDAKVGTCTVAGGRLWVGAGRSLPEGSHWFGPAVLWDEAGTGPGRGGTPTWSTPVGPEVPTDRPVATTLRTRRRGSAAIVKRTFDVAFASAMLLVTLPLWPLVMLAILIEDGRPFFFGHRREGRGGREFSCWKFRSMRRDAEAVKRQLILEGKNQADGAQFFMDKDPRLTRVGSLLRKTNLDELPQFWNVLRGDMSIVGPRPSPRAENRFCPAWREARLSVKPGITGLWQVSRTRQTGSDFQEWIRFDLHYAAENSIGLDLLIVWQTFTRVILAGLLRSTRATR